MPPERFVTGAEQRLAELEGDAGAAELRKRVLGRTRRYDRAVGQRLARPVVVGDDDVEPPRPRLGDLLDRGHAAVDREHEAAAFVGEARQRFALDAVAFLEAARQVPGDVGAELAQDQDGERSRADSVGVVVPVDADALPVRDRRANRLDCLCHVPEQKRVVTGHLSGPVESVSCRSIANSCVLVRESPWDLVVRNPGSIVAVQYPSGSSFSNLLHARFAHWGLIGVY